MNESLRRLKFLLCLAGALALLGNWPASATDLPTKAGQPRPRIALTYTGAGWYGAIGTFAEMDRATVDGPQGVAFSGFTAGASLAIGGGYMWGDGTTWKAIEILGHYQNVGGGSPVGAPNAVGSVNSKFGFTERFLLGGPLLAALQGLIPQGGLSGVIPVIPALPSGTTGSHPYIFLAAHQDDVSANYQGNCIPACTPGDSKVWRVRGGAGMGVQTQFTPTQPGAIPVVMDVWAEYLFAGSGLTLGNTGGAESSANMGGGARTGVLFKY